MKDPTHDLAEALRQAADKIDRLEIEKQQLQQKLEKLDSFIAFLKSELQES